MAYLSKSTMRIRETRRAILPGFGHISVTRLDHVALLFYGGPTADMQAHFRVLGQQPDAVPWWFLASGSFNDPLHKALKLDCRGTSSLCLKMLLSFVLRRVLCAPLLISTIKNFIYSGYCLVTISSLKS